MPLRVVSHVALAIVASNPVIAAAQRTQTGPHAIEIHVRERRLNGRQQPRFTPFQESERWVFIDSERTTSGGRTLFVTLDQRNGDSHAVVATDADGRIQRITARPRQRRALNLPGRDSAKEARMDARMELFEGFEDNARLVLPAAKAWEIVPVFHPARLSPGEQWTDTMAYDASALGNRQALTGRRVSTLVRDTTIDGRRLWIVRDSAAVRYDEHALIEERTLDTLVAVNRTGNGVLRGYMIYDPDTRLFLRRDDTLTVVGTAELRYPDGRSFTTPARDERIQHWSVYDPSGYNARQRVLGAERERTMSEGMVIVPTNDTDKRLAHGDVALRDSIVRLWESALDPNERAKLYDKLTLWTGRDTAFERRVRDMRIADGDTAFALENLVDRVYTKRWNSPAADTIAMRQLIAAMADPGIPFAFGKARDSFYEDIAQALYTTPPVTTRDTTKWPCTPAACRLLADEWRTAREPRLRQVALIAHAMLDPKTWADTLLAQPPSPLLAQPVMLARGVGANWPAATQAPIPPPNADWRRWTDWMNGVNPEFHRWQERSLPPRLRGEPSFRFDDTHATAIRFSEARTGRDIVGEFRERLARAASDSERAVFEYMLIGLDALKPTPDRVAAHLRSHSAVRRFVAARELRMLFAGTPPRADSATAFTLQDALIAMTVGGGKPWRFIDSVPNATRRALPAREVANETTLLLADSLSPALRAKWAGAGRVQIITSEEWNKRSERTAGTLFTLTSVERVGPFARLGIESSGRIARRPDQAPWLYYASTTYYLMQLDGEWVIVTMDNMIT